MLAYRGEVWLPNMKCIEQYIKKHKALLERYYTITLSSDIFSNPLVLATENFNDVLSQYNSNPFINENQLIRLNKDYPFLKLTFNK